MIRVLAGYSAWHDPSGQSMPAGSLVTAPFPVTETLSWNSSSTNVAVQLFAEVIATAVVALVPLQSPLHWKNSQPDAGVAVKVTSVPPG
jgi:hypothetical protein